VWRPSQLIHDQAPDCSPELKVNRGVLKRNNYKVVFVQVNVRRCTSDRQNRFLTLARIGPNRWITKCCIDPVRCDVPQVNPSRPSRRDRRKRSCNRGTSDDIRGARHWALKLVGGRL
jgi:hypothetical protein